MEFRCIECSRNFKSKESLDQHNSIKHAKLLKKKIPLKKYAVSVMVVTIIVLLSLSVYSYNSKPGSYDEFAKCLTENGAIVYGNDFCSYTNKQMNYFGKSKNFLNYVKCIDNTKLCDEKGIKSTPTWEIHGQMYPQVQTFEKLSALTGCKIN